MSAFDLDAGSVTKVCEYLLWKYRASLARRPASASTTGEDSRPTVETSLKSTAYDMAAGYPWYLVRVVWSRGEAMTSSRVVRAGAVIAPAAAVGWVGPSSIELASARRTTRSPRSCATSVTAKVKKNHAATEGNEVSVAEAARQQVKFARDAAAQGV